jgi:hypothetical protein
LKSGVVNSVWISSWISNWISKSNPTPTIDGMPTAIYEMPTKFHEMPNHGNQRKRYVDPEVLFSRGVRKRQTNDKDNKGSTK